MFTSHIILALVLLELVLLELVLLALVLQAPLLETHCLWYHVISSVCYGISDLSNAHWALDIMVQLFACFAQKLAPAGKKIAPTGRHSRHVFATLDDIANTNLEKYLLWLQPNTSSIKISAEQKHRLKKSWFEDCKDRKSPDFAEKSWIFTF